MRTDHQIDLGRSPFDDEEYAKIENRLWYRANKDNLFRFYKTSRPANRLYPIQDFYRLVPGNYPIMHYPLADLITKTMVGLIFSEKPEITLGTENEALNDEIDKLLDKVFLENDIEVLLQKAAELESYSGCVAFKPVIDPEFSEYPIIIPYPKEDLELVRKYNRVSAVIFKDYYEKEKKNYVLYTECGKGYIDYKLMKLNDGGKPEEVPLSTLEETKDLKRLEFIGKNGERIKQLMCVYKENKTNATSDYCGIIDDFQALDEVYSNMLNYIRKSKIHTYLPENMCQKDDKGNTIKPFDYHSDYTILYDSNPEGTETQMTRDVVDIQNTVDGYITTFNEILKHAVLSTGLSTASIGYDISGANASGEALSIREKVSMRTRSEKVHRWTLALTDLTHLILAFVGMNIGDGKIYLPEEVFDYDVLVAFAEYETPSFDGVVESLATAKEAGLVDTDTALKRLWADEYSEDEIELMKLNIQEEQRQAQQLIEDSLMETEDENTKEEDSEE